MKTTRKTKRDRGHCHICGAAVSLRDGWFDEKIVEFHGQIGHRSRTSTGIGGRCAGSRLPPSEVGQERIANYIAQNNARVASYDKPAQAPAPKLSTVKQAIVATLSKRVTSSPASDIAVSIGRLGGIGLVSRACDELVEAGVLKLGAPVGGVCSGKVRTYIAA